MQLRNLVSSLVAAGAVLALSACGSESSSSPGSSEQKADPAVALKEVGETRDGVRGALRTYRNGDEKAAVDQLSEAYLQHFEHVEGPLEGKDHDLKERLEHAIREDLREQMEQGRPPAEVESAARGVVADLDKAEALLR